MPGHAVPGPAGAGIPDRAVRDARPGDVAAIVALLAPVFAEGPVARWLDPDPATRFAHSLRYFAGAVDHAYAHGLVQVVTDAGDVVGAALWLPPSGPPFDIPGRIAGPVSGRLAVLDMLLSGRRPDGDVHVLEYLAVRRDRRGQGIGSRLLGHRHAWLDAMGIPAYLEANDPRNRALYHRHGYADLGAPVRLPDDTPIWPMLRS
jgi:GNAT superfamily N-acetyltransferase